MIRKKFPIPETRLCLHAVIKNIFFRPKYRIYKTRVGVSSHRNFLFWSGHQKTTLVKTKANEEAEHDGKKVTLNKPFRTPDGPKKFGVYVKNEKGNVVVVRFGDPNMDIKRDSPERRKSFRARHNCADPGPKWKARYWSCYQWRDNAPVAD